MITTELSTFRVEITQLAAAVNKATGAIQFGSWMVGILVVVVSTVVGVVVKFILR